MSDMTHFLIQRKIDAIVKYIRPLLPLANSHMVEFFTNDHWNKLTPEGVRVEVESIGVSDAISTFWEQRDKICNASCDKSKDLMTDVKEVESKFMNLILFIQDAEKHYLKPDGNICLTVDQLKDRLKAMGAYSLESLRLTEFMSDKKSHEVEMLSSIVCTVANLTRAQYTVEMGGGRGYLSTMLNMLYRMPVLNIDRAEVSEKSAHERIRKMQKQWPALVDQAKKTKNITKDECNDIEMPPEFGVVDSTVNDVNDELDKLDIEEKLYRHVTEFVTKDTDVVQLVRRSFDADSDVSICLTGLHTCGDLGSTSLRLYSRCPEIVCICTVPCCYHLLTETTTDETLYSESMMNDLLETGFPMSDYLKDFKLGRNARMLASHSIDRCLSMENVPSTSLYFRALLQVLLKKHNHENVGAERKMKGVAGKCANYSEYVSTAIKKLNITSFSMDDLQLNKFDSDHREFIDKLCLYYMLKMCLAQVIEHLILMDRLLYLYECGFTNGNSFLVKMFDPKLSPRCHALVSYRIKG